MVGYLRVAILLFLSCDTALGSIGDAGRIGQGPRLVPESLLYQVLSESRRTTAALHPATILLGTEVKLAGMGLPVGLIIALCSTILVALVNFWAKSKHTVLVTGIVLLLTGGLVGVMVAVEESLHIWLLIGMVLVVIIALVATYFLSIKKHWRKQMSSLVATEKDELSEICKRAIDRIGTKQKFSWIGRSKEIRRLSGGSATGLYDPHGPVDGEDGTGEVAYKLVGNMHHLNPEAKKFAHINKLNCPNGFPMIEACPWDIEPFFIFPYGGVTINLVKKIQPFNECATLQVVLSLAEHLACLHKGGIAHNDGHTENIVLSRDGKAGFIDYGNAIVSNYTQAGDRFVRRIGGYEHFSGYWDVMKLGSKLLTLPELAGAGENNRCVGHPYDEWPPAVRDAFAEKGFSDAYKDFAVQVLTPDSDSQEALTADQVVAGAQRTLLALGYNGEECLRVFVENHFPNVG